MNSREIKLRFAAEGGSTAADLNETSARFADWIAERAHGFSETDLRLLVRLGGALYAAELEQNWQQSWA